MPYLPDANFLIYANPDYYPMDRVPEYWNWLEHNARNGSIGMPIEIFEEVRRGNDDLARWLKKGRPGTHLRLRESATVASVRKVTAEGYGSDLSADEILTLGRDPFLISYALDAPEARCVVTTEVSAPSKVRQNRRISDVCRDFGVHCIDTFRFIRELDFSTGWNR